MTDHLLERAVGLFESSTGSSAERMGLVFQLLADELLRDAFPHDYRGSAEVFLDALKVQKRLMDAVRVHPETRTASYESDLAKLTGQPLPVFQTPAHF